MSGAESSWLTAYFAVAVSSGLGCISTPNWAGLLRPRYNLETFGKIMNQLAEPANRAGAGPEEMVFGTYLMGLATIAAGILDLIWRDFDPAHQPFGGLGYHLPGRVLFACIAGIWLVLAGSATLWPKTARLGTIAMAAIYLVFALLSLPHFYTLLHKYGFHLTLFFGLMDQIFLQLIVVAGCIALHSSLAPLPSSGPNRIAHRRWLIARWFVGICGILTGIGHLANTQALVSMIPNWMPLSASPWGASLWIVISGIGFILAGIAILTGILDLLAACLLVLMLLIFQIILVPIILEHPHRHQAWGGTAYNLAVAGSVCIFAASIARRSSSLSS